MLIMNDSCREGLGGRSLEEMLDAEMAVVGSKERIHTLVTPSRADLDSRSPSERAGKSSM